MPRSSSERAHDAGFGPSSKPIASTSALFAPHARCSIPGPHDRAEALATGLGAGQQRVLARRPRGRLQRALRPHHGDNLGVRDRQPRGEHQVDPGGDEVLSHEDRGRERPAALVHVFARECDGERHPRPIRAERAREFRHEFVDPRRYREDDRGVFCDVHGVQVTLILVPGGFMKTLIFTSALAAAGAGMLVSSDAPACGGCFIQPSENTVVTDHRMAFSISPAQTVLWDQIEYAGNPRDFSWVLPVRAGAVVQLSRDDWFAALDALTRPVITGPTANCGSGGVGCGGFSAKNAGTADENAGGGVQVLSQSVIGPYDTVTLKASDPNALESWLTVNGYVLPDAMRPTIAAYVKAGFDFIALRLSPGQGVQAMQPVRVVTQGADPTLPLRMVAAGVGPKVGITLYVISEGRYEARSPFFNATISDSQLVWQHAQNQSNYQPLSEQIMQSHNGRTWLTEFAQPVSLVGTRAGCSPSYYYYSGSNPELNLADAYLSQCSCTPMCSSTLSLVDGALGGGDSAPDGAPSDTGPGDAANAPSDGAVVGADGALEGDDGAAVPGDASGTDAAGSASDAAGGASDAAPGNGSPDASCTTANPCAGFGDLDVALVGLHPSDTWVTRLRAILPAEALSEADLQIQAASSQTQVSNRYHASSYDDPSYSPCPNSGGCNQSARVVSNESWAAAGSLAFLGTAFLRRRRRARRR